MKITLPRHMEKWLMIGYPDDNQQRWWSSKLMSFVDDRNQRTNNSKFYTACMIFGYAKDFL